MLAIKKHLFGIDMPIRTVGELRRWGFTPQRPVKRALEQDPARLKAWLGDEYPKIVARQRLRMPRSTGVTRPPFARTRTGFGATRWQADARTSTAGRSPWIDIDDLGDHQPGVGALLPSSRAPSMPSASSCS